MHRCTYGLCIRIIAGIPIIAVLSGCPDKTPSGPTDNFDRKALLRDVANNVILPTYAQFQTSAGALKTAVAAYQTALAQSPGAADTERMAAQQAWRDAMADWQQAELTQVGPAGFAGNIIGGESIRDEIYSWSNINPCAVDQELVLAEYGQADFIDKRLIFNYGLDALEYLLFRDDFANACPSSASINQTGSWAALSNAEIATRRSDYAVALANHIEQQAKRLHDAWKSDQGNFVGVFIGAGGAGSPYTSASNAIDDVFAAMFYIELRVKDDKLGIPTGMNVACASAPCLDNLESGWARASKEHVIANLKAFRKLYYGGDPGSDGVGFDNFLRELGAEQLAADIETRTDAAIAAAEAVTGSYFEALQGTNASQVNAVFTAVKALTDLLKGPFATVLSLRIPNEGAGDND